MAGSVACGRCGALTPLESNGDTIQQAEIDGKVQPICLVCINDLKLVAAQQGGELVDE